MSAVASQHFVLKGGMLLALFDARRPTRDIDLLGRALTNDHDDVRTQVRRIVAVDIDDGVVFDAESIKTSTIREDADYLGVRVTVTAYIAQARLKLSIDINFGDPVTPGPRLIELAQLLLPDTFTMLGYPIETVIAEKITTAVALADANTRDRDYADLYRLVSTHDLSGSAVTDAVNRTAAHRGIVLRPLSLVIPTLTGRRQSSYTAWRHKQGADGSAYPQDFALVTATVIAFADPLLAGDAAARRWSCATGAWSAN